MAEINWGLLQVPDIGANALSAFESGRERGRQISAQSAFTSYAENPNETSLNALAQYDPQFVMQQRQGMQKRQDDAQGEHREQLVVIGRLLDHAKDEPTYQQALAAARQGGIDLAEVPPSYDPAWINQTKMLVAAVQDPKGAEILSSYGKIAADRGLQPGTPEFSQFVTQAWQADQVKTIPYQAGGGVAGYNPVTGVTNTIIAPNTGGFEAGSPVGGGTSNNKTVGGKTYEKRGDQWFEVGGGSGDATGNFR